VEQARPFRACHPPTPCASRATANASTRQAGRPAGRVPATWAAEPEFAAPTANAGGTLPDAGGLLERVIRVATDPGQLVVDPFCGSGTAVAVAKTLGRRWVGIDISEPPRKRPGAAWTA